MAPQRKTANANDESRHDTGNGRDRTLGGAGNGAVSKSKKNNGASAAKENTTVASHDNGNGLNGIAAEPGQTIRFKELPRQTLHAYRNAHHLPVASSFGSFINESVLSDPTSIGMLSPTMNRPREKRRVGKEALARAVRRAFMDQSVNELEVEANLCYRVRFSDKAFRMRFLPNAKK